jgi:multidrug transporter EmrE-like cation transporter
MYYLVKALADSGLQSSVIFPINNVAIVIVSAISGILLFAEKLSKLQIAGILLACVSIAILAIQ